MFFAAHIMLWFVLFLPFPPIFLCLSFLFDSLFYNYSWYFVCEFLYVCVCTGQAVMYGNCIDFKLSLKDIAHMQNWLCLR